MRRSAASAIALGALLLAAACAHGRVDSVKVAECPYAVPPDAARVISRSLEELAGDYKLIQITWQPAPPVLSRGRLHLEVPDSAWREVPCGAGKLTRDLIGWYRPEHTDRRGWRRIVESTDPAEPGAVLRGWRLTIGQHCVMDGSSDNFVITAVSPRGFWGYWAQDLGIAMVMDSATGRIVPNAAGFFCALREGA
jgi:hypothetical protein